MSGTGTRDDPWTLRTPSGQSEFTAFRDRRRSIRRHSSSRLARRSCATTCAASTTCTRCSTAHGDWVPLGNADEQKPAAEGTVEAWGRSADNPVGGWYGLKKGLRGRFGELRPAGARGARARRGRAPAAEQPDARDLTTGGPARRLPPSAAARVAGRGETGQLAVNTP